MLKIPGLSPGSATKSFYMAKDKCFEKSYKEERLKRTYMRKNRRKERQKYNIFRYGNRRESTCPYCGGTMSWCCVCQMWSRTCCEEYGTCQCS